MKKHTATRRHQSLRAGVASVFALTTACIVVTACGDDDTAATATASANGGSSAGGAGTGSSNGGAGAGSGTTSSTLASVGSGGASTGCDKVDFLFVIDNSVSMSDQQAALIASFPGFINQIQTTLSATSDYHIMVTDSDDWGRCTDAFCGTNSTNADRFCNDPGMGYACEPNNFDSCDLLIGAGVNNPAGDGATNALCTFDSGKRYITEGQTNLADTFACAALVGLSGHPKERPMDSIVGALSADLNQAGGCNDGFVRDDAILVVTFISDDPNYEDAGTPQDWYDAVLASKNGNAEAIVMLGLTPAFDGCGGNNPDRGKHWSEFIALFGAQGLEASVCEADYAPFFTSAVSAIDDACDGFMPN